MFHALKNSLPGVAIVMCCVLLKPLTAHGDPGVLGIDDLTPLGKLAWAATGFEIPRQSTAMPLVDPEDASPEATILRRLDNAGKAAGFEGVLYINKDRGHSRVPPGMFPRLAHMQFSKALRSQNADFGLAGRILLPAIVIGNSSTAIKGKRLQRSLPRLAMTVPEHSARTFLTYMNNHLYVYPEHRDHDRVDRFPVNWPYMVISQGSSHSDMPFLRALLMALAALTPETRDMLNEKKLVAPTLQMILRRSLAGVYSREDYKKGGAHPVVFSKTQLAPERMVALAASLKPGDIPPVVRLGVLEEDFGIRAGLARMPEQLFNTPSSIARIWRGPGYSRQMLVSAEETRDPSGRELTFSWVLLQGDPARVRITPQGPRAKISIDWHDTFRAEAARDRVTNRVDIGVFAWNGVHESAPAIISIHFPGHQKRVYEPAEDGGTMRLVSIDYDADGRGAEYDPLLFWSATWTDSFRYDASGNPIELLRTSVDGALSLLTPRDLDDGRLIEYDLNNHESGRTLSMRILPTE